MKLFILPFHKGALPLCSTSCSDHEDTNKNDWRICDKTYFPLRPLKTCDIH